ncbi:MAG: FtsX-like permease family protein [Promethearchaeota archaeon]
MFSKKHQIIITLLFILYIVIAFMENDFSSNHLISSEPFSSYELRDNELEPFTIKNDPLFDLEVNAKIESTLLSSTERKNIEDHIKALSFEEMGYQGSRVTCYGQGLTQATSDPQYMNDFYDAVAYINKTLHSTPSMEVFFHYFPVTVPIDKGSWLAIFDSDNTLIRNITVYALEPNGVNPCSSNIITNSLFYIKNGKVEFYPDTNIQGGFIAMDFDSDVRWKTAMSFGASAIIFIEPEINMTKGMALGKSTPTPLNVPRVMIKQSDWNLLQPLLSNHKYQLKVNMNWEKRQGINILGFLNATKNIAPDDTTTIEDSRKGLFLMSHFDTYSIIPSLAPGVSDLGGIATMLEMARKYGVKASQGDLKRNIFFLALSGHYQSLAGSRYFVEDYMFSNDDFDDDRVSNPQDEGFRNPLAEQMWFGINLDLTGDYNLASPFAYGYYYSQFLPYLTAANRRPADMVQRYWSDFVGNWSSYVQDGLPPEEYTFFSTELLSSERGTLDFDHFQDYITNLYWLDSEPFWVSGTTSISLMTIFSSKQYSNTPSDTINSYGGLTEFVDNLVPQIAITIYLTDETINDFFVTSGETDPNLVHEVRRQGASWAEFCKLYGRIVVFPQAKEDTININASWVSTNISKDEADLYERSINQSIDGHFLVQITHRSGVTYGVSEIIMADDDTGFFNVTGLHNRNMGGLASGGSFRIEIFYLTDKGQILYVTDRGNFGTPSTLVVNRPILGDPRFREGVHRQLGQERIDYAVFECGSLAIYNVLNPRNLLDPQSESTVNRQADRITVTEVFNYNVIEVGTGSQPQRFFASFDPYGNAMVFAKGDEPIRIRVFGGEEYPIAVLTNSTNQDIQGLGLRTQIGTITPIYHAIYKSTKDFWVITEDRITRMKAFNVHNPSAEETHQRATELLLVAEDALFASDPDYYTYYINIINAYSLEREAYASTRSAMLNVIQSTVFFFVLLLPFAFIFERLVFNYSGLKRIISLVGIFIFFNLLIFFFQPGYHLASNVFMVGIGFIMIVLSIPVLVILGNDAYNYLQEVRKKVIGEHFAEFGRIEAGLVSFGVAISNLRKRRFSTALTVISITLITFSLVSFVSVSSAAEVRATPLKADYIGYNGLLIQRIGVGRQKLSYDLLDYLEAYNIPGNNVSVVPRIWSDPLQGSNWYIISEYEGKFSKGNIGAILGLKPQEIDFLDYKSILIGEWFSNESYNEVILPTKLANILFTQGVNETIGQEIHVRGVDLKVVGLINTSKLIQPLNETFDNLARTLDQEDITPISDKGNHFSLDETIIIPFNLAADNPWNSYKKGIYLSLAQIALKFESDITWDELQDITINLRKSLPLLDIYIGLQQPTDKNPFAGIYAEYRKGQSFQLIGIETLIIPVIIAVSVVAGTVLSAVQQQLKEIEVYNALGLSPENVGFMYFAQSLVYGLLGGVFGYSIGMVILAFLEQFSLLPATFVPNYTGFSVILAIGLSIASVIVASIIPIRKAVLLSLPSLQRKWQIATKPEEDTWLVPFPFSTASLDEAQGVIHFLWEYFESHRSEGIGSFAVLESHIKVISKKRIEFIGQTRLAPWNWGIVQDFNIVTEYNEEEEKYLFENTINRISGERGKWEKVNEKRFFRDIRKQLLLWRGIDLKKREYHIEEGKKLIGEI